MSKEGESMKIYEFGRTQPRRLLIFQCAAEPWTVFLPICERMSEHFHVYMAAADGHNPEDHSTFSSVEDYAHGAAVYLRTHGAEKLEALYGLSMGGGAAMRFLAAEKIPVEKAIIDAGITPYHYTLLVKRLIALRDLGMIYLVTHSRKVMELAAPPERWTRKGVDPGRSYADLLNFFRAHYSARTIYNTFWSANNWKMPSDFRGVATEMEYWYGEEEKKARKENIQWAAEKFPQIRFREFRGLAHGELAMVYPDRCCEEAMRFFGAEEDECRDYRLRKEGI
ncbi:MAG: alpha/beta fold hydrolase [Bulleidia sp.]